MLFYSKQIQHAYREGHSTSTALTKMTDDWLREIVGKGIGEAGSLVVRVLDQELKGRLFKSPS
jgi:hypothetical protein